MFREEKWKILPEGKNYENEVVYQLLKGHKSNIIKKCIDCKNIKKLVKSLIMKKNIFG